MASIQFRRNRRTKVSGFFVLLRARIGRALAMGGTPFAAVAGF
jgi:hypothetical protein